MMPTKWILFFAFACAIGRGAIAQRYYSDDEIRRHTPKNTVPFTLAGVHFTPSDTVRLVMRRPYLQLDQVSKYDGMRYTGEDSLYSFVIFYPDGRCFGSFPIAGSYPSLGDFNNFSYGQYGLYRFNGETLSMEYYTDREYGMEVFFANVTKNRLAAFAHGNGVKPKGPKKDMKVIYKLVS